MRSRSDPNIVFRILETTRVGATKSEILAKLPSLTSSQLLRPLFENLSLLNEHQYDGARIVAILQSQYPGAFDDFTYQYTFNATSNKTSLEMDGNGSDFFASGGDKQQIDNTARLFGFQLTGFSQFAKTQELIIALETP